MMTTSNDNKKSPLQHMRKALKWILVLVALSLLLVWAFMPHPAEVDLGQVTKGPLAVTVDEDGITQVRERFAVSAPLPGRLLRISLDVGDTVKKGDLLATIVPGVPQLLDPRARAQAEAVIKAAEATVARMQTQLKASEVDANQSKMAYERNKGLHEKGNIADATFEESERLYLAANHAQDAATSSMEVAKFELEQARAALLQSASSTSDFEFEIQSPIDGRVLRIHEESARIVPAGTLLLEVGDPSTLEMKIDVLSQDSVRIKTGQRVHIEHWGGEPLTGSVRLIEPAAYTRVSALGVDEQRVDVVADFDDQENFASLGDGFRIEAKIVVWEKPDVLKVPVGALFRSDGSWAVYRLAGNVSQLVKIEIDHNNGDFAEVVSGLDEGDLVVLHPGDRIAANTRIRPR